MRGVDARAVTDLGVPGPTLMENAGRGAAEALLAALPERGLRTRGLRVAIVCGRAGGTRRARLAHADLRRGEARPRARPRRRAGRARQRRADRRARARGRARRANLRAGGLRRGAAVSAPAA